MRYFSWPMIIGIHITTYMQAIHYAYPVAVQDNMLYITHQLSQHEISLYGLDMHTHKVHALLDRCYQPAYVQLMPDNSGFSFIDHGYIRYKKHNRSKPDTIHIQTPLYDISCIGWFDAHTLCCCAKKRMRYGIFEVTLQGDTKQILYSITHDYLYPNLLLNDLFCIERSDDEYGYSYAIIRLAGGEKSEFQKCTAQTIIKNADKPLAFLHMISAYEGFVVEHPILQSKDNPVVVFTYYHLICESDVWKFYKLFDFQLPKSLFSAQSSKRLYESVMPCMPRYYKNTIYFMHASNDESVNIYNYNLADSTSKQLTYLQHGQVACSPLCIDSTMWYGGSYEQQESEYEYTKAVTHLAFS